MTLVPLCIRYPREYTTRSPMAKGGGGIRGELAAVVGPDMSGGASSSSATNPVGLNASTVTEIDVNKFPVLEYLPSFKEGRVGTPKTVSLARVLLPSGEAVSSFALNLHFMGGKLKPFMDFAVVVEADLEEMFDFRDAGTQVASSQRDAPLTNCWVAGCWQMTRLVLLVDLRSLGLLVDEWVILPSVLGAGNHAAQTVQPVAPPAAGMALFWKIL